MELNGNKCAMVIDGAQSCNVYEDYIRKAAAIAAAEERAGVHEKIRIFLSQTARGLV